MRDKIKISDKDRRKRGQRPGKMALLLCTVYALGVPPFVYYIGIPSWIDPFFRILLGALWFTTFVCLPAFSSPAAKHPADLS